MESRNTIASIANNHPKNREGFFSAVIDANDFLGINYLDAAQQLIPLFRREMPSYYSPSPFSSGNTGGLGEGFGLPGLPSVGGREGLSTGLGGGFGLPSVGGSVGGLNTGLGGGFGVPSFGGFGLPSVNMNLPSGAYSQPRGGGGFGTPVIH